MKLLAEEPASSASASPSWVKLVGCGYPARVKGLDLLVVEPSSGQALPEDRVGEVTSAVKNEKTCTLEDHRLLKRMYVNRESC